MTNRVGLPSNLQIRSSLHETADLCGTIFFFFLDPRLESWYHASNNNNSFNYNKKKAKGKPTGYRTQDGYGDQHGCAREDGNLEQHG